MSILFQIPSFQKQYFRPINLYLIRSFQILCNLYVHNFVIHYVINLIVFSQCCPLWSVNGKVLYLFCFNPMSIPLYEPMPPASSKVAKNLGIPFQLPCSLKLSNILPQIWLFCQIIDWCNALPNCQQLTNCVNQDAMIEIFPVNL